MVVIITILMLVALPGYQESMKKSRRADGMRDLVELASRQARFYAQNSRYTDDIDSLDGLNFERTTSSGGHYDLSVEICVDEEAGDFGSCYVLKAVPRGQQANDSACGILRLDSRGQRSASGSLGDACW